MNWEAERGETHKNTKMVSNKKEARLSEYIPTRSDGFFYSEHYDHNLIFFFSELHCRKLHCFSFLPRSFPGPLKAPTEASCSPDFLNSLGSGTLGSVAQKGRVFGQWTPRPGHGGRAGRAEWAGQLTACGSGCVQGQWAGLLGDVRACRAGVWRRDWKLDAGGRLLSNWGGRQADFWRRGLATGSRGRGFICVIFCAI